MDSSAESDDWVQRRTPKACKLCRKKKVRCDGEQPACSQCVIHKSDCVYLPRAVRAKRKARHRASKERRDSVVPNTGERISASGSNRSVASGPSAHDQPQRWSGNQPFASNGEHRTLGTGLTLPNTPEYQEDGDWGSEGVMPRPLIETGQCADDAPGQTIRCASVGGDGLPEGSFPPLTQEMDVPHNTTMDSSMDDAAVLRQLGIGDLEGRLDSVSPTMARFAHAIGYDDIDFDMLGPDLLEETTSAPGLRLRSEPNASADANVLSFHAPASCASEDIGHSLQISMTGHIKYMGPSMSFIPATGPGREWIRKITGSSYFSDQIQDFLEKWTPLPNGTDSQHTYDYTAMPAYEDATRYVDAYFSELQCAFPILDEKAFLARLETTYGTLMPTEDPTWCAMVNVVLAIGCRATPGSNEDQYCQLFVNALSLFTQVSLGWSRLCKVQTLVLMYLFLSHTTSPHSGYTFLSCAVSECYALGLHIKPTGSWPFSSSELVQRRLLFWAIFCLDAQLLSRLGRPPMIRRDEITLPLPDEPTLKAAFSSQPRHHPGSDLDVALWGRLFIHNIKTSQLILDVHDCIYTRPDLVVLERRAAYLEAEVDKLSSSIPRTEGHGVKDSATTRILDMPPGTVLAYAVIQTNLDISKWTLRLRVIGLRICHELDEMKNNASSQKPQRSEALSEDLRVAGRAAVSLVRLVSLLSKGESSGCYWYLAPLPVFAFYVLFLAILHQPLDEQASPFMELMSIVIESTVESAHVPHPLISDAHLPHFLTFFSRTARMAIARAREKASSVGSDHSNHRIGSLEHSPSHNPALNGHAGREYLM